MSWCAQPEFVQDEEVVAFELLVEAFELPLLPALEEPGHQARDTQEAHPPSLLTCGEGEGCGEEGLARPAVADEEDVLVAVQVVAPDEFPHQGLVGGHVAVGHLHAPQVLAAVEPEGRRPRLFGGQEAPQ